MVLVGRLYLVVRVGGTGKALRSRKGERGGTAGRIGDGSGDIVAEGEEREVADIRALGTKTSLLRAGPRWGVMKVGEESGSG